MNMGRRGVIVGMFRWHRHLPFFLTFFSLSLLISQSVQAVSVIIFIIIFKCKSFAYGKPKQSGRPNMAPFHGTVFQFFMHPFNFTYHPTLFLLFSHLKLCVPILILLKFIIHPSSSFSPKSKTTNPFSFFSFCFTPSNLLPQLLIHFFLSFLPYLHL